MPASGSASRRASLLASALLALALAAAGCSPHRVELAPTPLRGATSAPELGARPEAPGAAWWLALPGPELDGLIRRALAQNQDAAAARERLAQALALRRRAGADLWPRLELELGVDQELYARGRPRQNGLRRDAALALDWSPDLFGRQRNTHRARAADAFTRLHEAEAFRLALSATVADVYLGILEQRRLLAVLDEQMGTANELLRIIRQRFTEGLISNLDVLQQESQLAELESQLPAARASLENLQGQLSALLAASPGDRFADTVGATAPLPEIAPPPTLERADALLLRRPDLRAAQAALVAADAETGRALAERLPALTLSADALHVKTDSGPAVTTLDLGAELVQPLLDWGSRRQEWLRAKARYRERLATYTQAYLDAIWEVDTLVRAEARQRELLESLARRRAILEALIRQARNRYDSGLTDYLPVLSATQQLYSVEQRQVRERRRLASLRVALHRALGGPVPDDEAGKNAAE
jgi:multidrug efflux system outer membrane protein